MSSPRTTPRTESGDSTFSAKHALALVTLLWTVALNPITGLLAGNAQAEVAIHFQTTHIAWFTLGSALIGTFMTPFAMKAAAMYGKKRTLIAVTSFGVLGDVIAALATNYEMLVAGRVMAGVYAPSAFLAYALARDVFPKRLVSTASGVLAASAGIVGLVGPFLSAWLLDTNGFRAALWFITGSAAVCLVLQIIFISESPVRERETRMDWMGGLLLGGGLTAIVYAIGEGSHWGWTSDKSLLWIGGGLVAVLVFVAYESRTAHPLVPLSLIKRRRVWSVFLATSVAAGATYAVGTAIMLLTLMPHIPGTSDGLGWSVTKSAVVSAPLSVLVIVVAVLTGKLARRFDTRLLLALGGALTTIGYAIGSQWHHSEWHFVLWGVFVGPGMGLVVSIAPIMVLQSVDPKEQALANGSQSLVQGVVQVVITQLVFTMMSQDGVIAHGTQFYRDSGFTNAFLLVAGACAIGTLLIATIPKVRPVDAIDAGQAA
ncbi:MFS transporter [Streptomyces sp. DH41]|uniref:MFS transporter n=1 Tax=Streptomyces sp. DH41 TaxID=3040125 RepID=UPI002442A12D|nr:MFS transporter [Streptomyces sp. DH41]MDG9724351.1 MFS transporter [Streptomyces sp. DH41]